MRLIETEIIRIGDTLFSMDLIRSQVQYYVINRVWQSYFVNIPPKGIRATDFK